MKIPKTFEELNAMPGQDQRQLGDFLGRLYAHDSDYAEKLTGVPADQMIGFVQTGDIPGRAQMAGPEKFTAPGEGQPGKPSYPGPKLFIKDVRSKAKPIRVMDEAVQPGPYDVLIREINGEQEIIAWGSRAKPEGRQ